MANIQIQPITEVDRSWVEDISRQCWGAEYIIAHGEIFFPATLGGFIAYDNNKRVGLATYHIKGAVCEIISLNALKPHVGIGSALLRQVFNFAKQQGCSKLYLTTTNDNTNALLFYQKFGFHITAFRRDVIAEYRKIKAEIPLLNENGIPIRDEIELEMEL